VELGERSLSELNEHAQHDSQRLEEHAGRIAALTAQLTALADQVAAAAEAMTDAEVRVAAAGTARARGAEHAQQTRANADHLRDQTQAADREIARAQAHLSAIDDRERQLDDELTRLDRRRLPFSVELDAQRVLRNSLVVRRWVAVDESTRLESQVHEHIATAASLGDRHGGLARRLTELRDERTALESRRQLLEEMQRAREGVGQAVRTVLGDRQRFPAVTGLLGDHVETDLSNAPVVEAALGRDLELLLVERTQHVAELAHACMGVDGRVTLVAADAPTGATAERPAVDGVAPVAQFLNVRPEAAGPVARLLRDTWVVKDLETALELAAGSYEGARLVTPDGAVVDGDGRVTVGRPTGGGAGEGLLTRRAELADLSRRLEALTIEMELIEGESAALTARTDAARQAHREVEEALAAVRRAAVDAEYQRDRCDQMIQRVEHEQSALAIETDDLHRRVRGLEAERVQIEDGLGQRRASLAALQGRLALAEASANKASVNAAAATEALAAARVDSTHTAAVVEAARRERRTVELALDEQQRQRAQVAEHAERRRQQDGSLRRHHYGEPHCPPPQPSLCLKVCQANLTPAAAEVAAAGTAVEDAAGRLRLAREQATILSATGARWSSAAARWRSSERTWKKARSRTSRWTSARAMPTTQPCAPCRVSWPSSARRASASWPSCATPFAS
jgi:chromosome segregation ATPase